MIKIRKSFQTIVWFANKINTRDVWKIASYRDFSGVKAHVMFRHTSYTLETDLLSNSETIFNSFKSNVRNEIRKAEKLDFQFSVNSISIDDFTQFYNSFAKAKGFAPFVRSNLTCYNSENLMILSAYHHEELLVTHVYLIDGARARLLHSVSQIHNIEDDEKRKLIGYFNKKLHWEDISYLKTLGFSLYDWGGYSHKFADKALMGINAFKKSFGGIEREVINYNSILRELMNCAIKIKQKL